MAVVARGIRRRRFRRKAVDPRPGLYTRPSCRSRSYTPWGMMLEIDQQAVVTQCLCTSCDHWGAGDALLGWVKTCPSQYILLDAVLMLCKQRLSCCVKRKSLMARGHRVCKGEGQRRVAPAHTNIFIHTHVDCEWLDPGAGVLDGSACPVA
jgi:hypothetical protein